LSETTENVGKRGKSSKTHKFSQKNCEMEEMLNNLFRAIEDINWKLDMLLPKTDRR